jgi:hypothetical protein
MARKPEAAKAEGSASAELPGVDVSLDAHVRENGEVRCEVACNGQHAVVVFTGSYVTVSVPSRRS